MARRQAPAATAGAWRGEVLPLFTANSFDAFKRHVFRLVPQVIGCDYVSVLYRRLGDGFSREDDSLGRSFRGAFMRRYVELTPAIPLVLASPGVPLICTRFGLPSSGTQLKETAFYREVMTKQGWRHAAVLCFWTDPVGQFPIAVVSAFRREGRRDFSDRELAQLQQLHPLFAAAVLRFYELSTTRAEADGLVTALRRTHRGILVLDSRLRVIQANPDAGRACARWSGRRPSRGALDSETGSLPAELARACRELASDFDDGTRDHRRVPTKRRHRIAGPTGSGLAASVSIVHPGDGLADPRFVIEFDRTSPALFPAPPTQQEGLASLTPAEREVALIVAQGASNDEAAEQLGKSVHAVKFLLHRVYTKLGITTRTRLALRLRHPGMDSRQYHV